MRVLVRYWAQARQSAARSEEDLEMIEPATVTDVLRAACSRHGDGLRRLLLAPDGRVRPNVLLFGAARDEALTSAAALEDGDVVNILPPMAGG